MELTQHQEEALNNIWQAAKTKRIVKLSGYAGTGKTSLIQFLKQRWSSAEVVTPTNRAAAVLRKKGRAAETIYFKFFTPEEYRDGKGKKSIRFVPNYQLDEKKELAPGKVRWADVAIVDESSMVHKWLIDELAMMTDRIILVGDGFQLPPVSDRRCPAGIFNTLPSDATLTEVLRQANGSPILEVAGLIREAANGGDKWRSAIMELGLATSPSTEMYGEPKRRYITATHIARGGITEMVREIAGHGDQPFPVPGEPIIVKDNVNDYLYNGAGAVVYACKQNDVCPFFVDLDVEDDFGNSHVLTIPPWDLYTHPSEGSYIARAPLEVLQAREQYDAYLKEYGGKPPIWELGAFKLTRVHFGYAMTCHEAQGSEWDDVVVHGDPISIRKMFAPRTPKDVLIPNFMERWFYTATTRASSQLGYMKKFRI